MEVPCKKVVLQTFANLSGWCLWWSLFFNKVADKFIKKNTLAKAFSCEFCEILKGKVTQIQKALINYRLRVSKVS